MSGSIPKRDRAIGYGYSPELRPPSIVPRSTPCNFVDRTFERFPLSSASSSPSGFLEPLGMLFVTKLFRLFCRLAIERYLEGRPTHSCFIGELLADDTIKNAAGARLIVHACVQLGVNCQIAPRPFSLTARLAVAVGGCAA